MRYKAIVSKFKTHPNFCCQRLAVIVVADNVAIVILVYLNIALVNGGLYRQDGEQETNIWLMTGTQITN